MCVCLICIRQTLRTFQPIDELKKGPFLLEASVVEYRTVEEGVEVDIKLAAADRANQPVWEGLLTLLSRDMKRITSKQPPARGVLEVEEVKAEERAVVISVPWWGGLRCAWASGDYSPHHLFTLTAKLLGHKQPIAPSLWQLSKCLAEIEKHKGVDAVRAPVSVHVWFRGPLFVPGKAIIKFWETAPEATSCSHRLYSFQMEEQGVKMPCIVGEICECEQ
ncbi:uncharacterized protein si:ch211-12e13.1 [Megalops cyprinoides]|uniref:uncharacterized protein si:ch211-12e13.1 n=1 Tax=Megalops cyprinoides TaxID=118141 RepID=UPI001864CACC|nr:uncharacterized protein si:ch211-12e13.1 [Megalops cyprinoides]